MSDFKVEISIAGTKRWYKKFDQNCQLTDRDDGLLPEWTSPVQWLLHREDGPAIEYADGSKEWYRNGKRHREDGPAIEWSDGTKEWHRNGKLHREDGQAVECADGSKFWYRNGKLHREDGPAIEWDDGTKVWYLDGKKMTEKEFDLKTGKMSETLSLLDLEVFKEFSSSFFQFKSSLKAFDEHISKIKKEKWREQEELLEGCMIHHETKEDSDRWLAFVDKIEEIKLIGHVSCAVSEIDDALFNIGTEIPELKDPPK
jgi:antitoxin component YwqK of YwqJK toxin-antitoxin module